eukprot:s840_g31.t1
MVDVKDAVLMESQPQGTGRAKRIPGKLVWIQDAVRHGHVQLVQTPTICNLLDLGTKALETQRLRDFDSMTSDGVRRWRLMDRWRMLDRKSTHGGRGVTAPSKTIARVILVLGLAPTGTGALRSVAGVSVLDEDVFHESNSQRCLEPNAMSDQGGGISSIGAMMFCVAFLPVLAFCLFLVQDLQNGPSCVQKRCMWIRERPKV